MFFTRIIGISPNNRFFRYRGDFGTKSTLFLKMILMNIGQVVIRGFIFAIVFKLLVDYGWKHASKILPSFREIILFPIIIGKVLITFVFGFVNRNFLGNE